MPVVPPCSEALTRRTTTVSSSSSSAVRVRMSPGHHRSLCLNNESRSLRDDLFTVMPQNPHYEPLDKYSEGIREGIKVGLDIVFINLAQKFVSLTSPVEILSDLEEYVAQLSELDEMGYDCTKIWERFDTLRALSEQEQVARLKLEETTSTRRDKEVNATITHTRISELESELKKLKAVSKTREQETKL